MLLFIYHEKKIPIMTKESCPHLVILREGHRLVRVETLLSSMLAYWPGEKINVVVSSDVI